MESESSSKRSVEPETSSSSESGDDDVEEVGSEKQAMAVFDDLKENENNGEDRWRILKSFPPGYAFRPKDRHLIECFLLKKVLKQPLPLNLIYDVNLYKHNPYDLARYCKPWSHREWYFFTSRDRKYRNGRRPNRATGDGYWKATGKDKMIKRKGRVIGQRKSLVFYKGKAMHGSKTDWIMHEYRIDGLAENTRTRTETNMRLDDWVLCRIYKKKKKNNSPEKVTSSNEAAAASQVLSEDAQTEKQSVDIQTEVHPPSSSQPTEPVKLQGSIAPHLYTSPSYPQDTVFMYANDMPYTSIDCFGNPSTAYFGFQSQTMTNTDDDLACFLNECQSQYVFMDSRKEGVDNFALWSYNDPPPAASGNPRMAPGCNNICSSAVFNGLPPPPAASGNPRMAPGCNNICSSAVFNGSPSLPAASGNPHMAPGCNNICSSAVFNGSPPPPAASGNPRMAPGWNNICSSAVFNSLPPPANTIYNPLLISERNMRDHNNEIGEEDLSQDLDEEDHDTFTEVKKERD